ncbi:MAG: methyl-accepting chemotaxis protein [Halocynthiibacter sp.]|jgi:methyl-accepting chemotaxis protein
MMSDTLSNLDITRNKATRLIATMGMAASLPVAIIAWLIGTNAIFCTVGTLAFFAISFAARRKATTGIGRILAAQGLVGQAIVLNAGFMSHPWQIDTHMVYFAVMAIFVMMVGLRALILAAATIAVHHVLLTLVMPSMVYPSVDLLENVGRTLMHAVILIIETAALALAINSQIKLSQTADRERKEAQNSAALSDQAAQVAEAEQANALAAQKKAEEAVKSAAEARDAAEAARREAETNAENVRLAEEKDAASRAIREQELSQLLDVFRTKLDRLSAGDLSARITEPLASEYHDLRDNYNNAVGQLADAFGAVAVQSHSIQDQTQEISGAATDLSGRTEQQASTLAEIASSLDQLTRTIQKVANDATESQSLAETTSQQANNGTDIMNRAVSAMAAIQGSSQEIQKIISVIDDIAFQTNLLALNAGVEAARAGEAGRGFAVVASEVRALAQRSSDAAREINALINSSVTQVADGVDLVNQTGTALSGIQSAVSNIDKGMRSIAASTQDQSRGLSEVNVAISALENVTQQNAAMFEETNAANTILFSSSKRLNDLVEKFSSHKSAEPTLRAVS